MRANYRACGAVRVNVNVSAFTRVQGCPVVWVRDMVHEL